jgi:hypothetical protein
LGGYRRRDRYALAGFGCGLFAFAAGKDEQRKDE